MTNTETTTDDVVVATLKKRYFDVLSKEDYPRTPKLTEEADNLERAIRELNVKAHGVERPNYLCNRKDFPAIRY